MKVLFFNHNYEGYGTYWRCLNLGRYLARRGHKVTMVTVSKKEVDLKIRRQKIEKGMDMIILPRIKLAQYHTGHTVRAVINAYLALTRKYDLLHVFVFPVHPMALPALVGKWLKRKPLLVDGDDLWRGGWASYHPLPIRKQLEWTEDWLCRFADKVTVVSEKMRQRFLEAGVEVDKIIKVANGANVAEIMPQDKKVARKKLGLDQNGEYVLVMGHTFTEGLFIFLTAFAKVAEKRKKTKLLFLGKMALSDKDKRRLKKATGKIGLERIVFLGEKPFADVAGYLGAADVLALPMDDDPIEEARSPMRLGDYLASGRPIISNAVGEVKVVLEKGRCGLISPPRDSQVLADNLGKALANKRLADNLGKKARLWAEHELAWPKIAAQLEELYMEILNRR